MSWLSPLPSVHTAAPHLVVVALLIVWNVVVAGRISRARMLPGALGAVSVLAALLIAPAAFVLVASTSSTAGRAVSGIVWLWPAAVALAAVQAAYALAVRVTAPAVAIPILAFDALLALIATVQTMVAHGAVPSAVWQALVAADARALAVGAHPLALLIPYYLHVPILAPISPIRRNVGTPLRGAVAIVALLWAALILAALPGARRSVQSYRRYASARLQERPAGDFAVGVRILPTLTGWPAQSALVRDLALVDTLDVGVMSVALTPRAMTRRVLDSLGRALDDERGARKLLLVMDLSSAPRALDDHPAEWNAYLQHRVDDAARAAARLHPDYLVPELDTRLAIAGRSSRIPAGAWREYLVAAARAVHRASPRSRVLAHVAGFTAADSARYAWAATDAPVDGVAITLFPWFGGAATLDARMATVDRWMNASRSTREHWVLDAGGFPFVHGERSQLLALWGTLAWATSHPQVRGLVAYESDDYGAPLGLRASMGRIRPAATRLAQAIHALGESAPAPPPPVP
ncbi:MAG TPA: hypothetical protein VFK13_10850 [Gemmatimonadaceae bacterium]|nr:hypothetical protein [Gemmatimonadaceae bacterium]